MGSASFNYSGGWQTFNVPTGVTTISVSMNGAGAPGNQTAGRVIGTISVSDTDVLYIVCGQEGINGVSGGAGSHSNSGGGATFGAGGAGGAGYNANGGDSGGGYSAIRLNSTSGTIKCVAGGSGGDSGDGGNGGAGGGSTGGSGGRGTAGSGATTASTGGSQSGPGQGGTSSSGSSFAGGDASSSVLGRAGAGGDTGGFDGPGGGGGGGGYYGGGGGCGGSSGYAPGVGGAGGSSYVGHMASVSTNDHGGGGGGGNVTLTWTDPDQPPATPSISAPATGVRTSAVGTVALTASVSSPPLGSTQTRLKVMYDTDSAFGSPQTVYSSYRSTAGSLTVNMTSLSSNSRYYVRVWAQGDSGLLSSSYDTTNFYTDYAPSVPTSVGPSGSTLSMGSVTLTATVSDPDGDTVRANFQYDTSSTFSAPTTVSSGYVASGAAATYNLTGLATDTQYWVRAQAQDSPGLTSAFSSGVSFWTNRTPLAPTLNQPFNGEVFDTSIQQTFSWTFNDPDAGDTQAGVTVRYRPVGAGTWSTITPAPTSTTTTFGPGFFTPNTTYEWQVQTTDAGGLTGPFSASSTFSGNAPAVNMAAQGGLSILGIDSIGAVSALAATVGMTIVPALTKMATAPMSALASLAITPVKTIFLTSAMSARGGLTINSSMTHTPTVAMGGTAALTVGGTKNVPAAVAFGALGAILFQSVSGEVLMKGSAGMTVLANSLNLQGSVAMQASSGMSIQPAVSHEASSVTISANAGLTIAAVVSTGSVVGMTARASVSDSAGLSRIVPVLMSVRAQIAIEPDPIHPGIVAMSARSGMTINGFANHIDALTLIAQAGMAVAGMHIINGGAMPMGATVAMEVNGHRSFTGAVEMGASAGIAFAQTQYTLLPPYLVATDSQGDTLTFTRNSTPVPSNVINTVTINDIGSVAP